MSHDAETVTSPLVTALCRSVVDYAGTFPPAELGLGEAIERYARYRGGADAWMLHRFVVAARDLDGLNSIDTDSPWPLTVVCGDRRDVERARAWRRDTAVIASLETNAIAPHDASGCDVFVERSLPLADEDIEELKRAGAMLKIRLGGETIPSTPAVARALWVCADAELPLKATAGLHHAIRSEAHGFVNVLLAATLASEGGDVPALEALLDETDPDAFDVGNDSLAWQDRRFDVAAIARARRLFRSFGSCSFEEPVESVSQLGLR